jgi:hypothetical protein
MLNCAYTHTYTYIQTIYICIDLHMVDTDIHTLKNMYTCNMQHYFLVPRPLWSIFRSQLISFQIWYIHLCYTWHCYGSEKSFSITSVFTSI